MKTYYFAVTASFGNVEVRCCLASAAINAEIAEMEFMLDRKFLWDHKVGQFASREVSKMHCEIIAKDLEVGVLFQNG